MLKNFRNLFALCMFIVIGCIGLAQISATATQPYNVARILIQDRLNYDDQTQVITLGSSYTYKEMVITLESCQFLKKNDTYASKIFITSKNGQVQQSQENQSYWFYSKFPGDDKFSSKFINIRLIDCTYNPDIT